MQEHIHCSVGVIVGSVSCSMLAYKCLTNRLTHHMTGDYTANYIMHTLLHIIINYAKYTNNMCPSLQSCTSL